MRELINLLFENPNDKGRERRKEYRPYLKEMS